MWGRLGIALGIGLLTAASGGSFAIGFAVGSLIAMLLFPVNTDGARLEELKASRSAYAEPVPIVYGAARVGGIMIQATAVRERRKTEKVGPGAESTTYKYYLTMAFAVAEGPIQEVVRIWADKEVILDKRTPETTTLYSDTSQLMYQRYKWEHRVYPGSEDQEPDPLLAADAPDGLQPAYRGLAYVVIEDFPLHKFGNRIPQFEFEVVGIVDPTLPKVVGPTVVTSDTRTDRFGDPIRYETINAAYTDPETEIIYYKALANGVVGNAPADWPDTPDYSEWGEEQGYVLVAADKFTGEVLYWKELEYLPGELQPAEWEAEGNPYPIGGWPDPITQPYGRREVLFSTFSDKINTVYASWQQEYAWFVMYDALTFEIIQTSPTLGSFAKTVAGFDLELNRQRYICSNEFGTQVVCFFDNVRPGSVDLGSHPTYLDIEGWAVWQPGSNQVAFEHFLERGYVAADQPDCACFDRNGHLWVGHRDMRLTRWTVVGTSMTQIWDYGPILPTLPSDEPLSTKNTIVGINYVPDSDELLIWGLHQNELSPMVRFSVENGAVSSDVMWYRTRTSFDSFGQPVMIGNTASMGVWTNELRFAGNGLYPGEQVFDEALGDYRPAVVEGPGFYLFDADTGEEVFYPIDDWAGDDSEPQLIQSYPGDPESDEYLEHEVLLYGIVIYDPLTNGFWAQRDGNVFSGDQSTGGGVYLLDRAGITDVALRDIVIDVTHRVGGQAADYDYDALTQRVRGFVVERRKAARAALEELQPIFAFDIVESDWQLKANNRAEQVPVVTVPEDALVRSGEDHHGFVFKRINDRELPRAIDLAYFDQTRDYQLGNEVYRRPANSQHSEDTQTIAAPVVMWPDEAATAGKRLLQAAWAERSQATLTLPPSWLILEPGDLVLLGRKETTFEYRITGQALGGNFALAIEGSSSDSGAYATTARGASGGGLGGGGYYGSAGSYGYQEPVLTVAVQPVVYVVDLPLLRTQDDSAGIYVTAGPATGSSGTTWDGAVIQTSSDRLTWTQVAAVVDETVGGTTVTVLPGIDAWASWDRTSTVRVRLRAGVLENRTEAQLLASASANLALLGNELVQFATATPLANNVWELATLLRGRLGSEAYVGTHQAGETFLLIDPATLRSVEHEPSVAGDDLYYRASSDDAPIPNSPSVQVEHGNRRLRCYAPYFIAGERDGDDLTITWLRRSRVPGRALHDSPLFEAEERYEIDILDGSTVVRTIAAATMTAAYTAAEQTADFGNPQAELDLNIYQLNATIGRGYPGSATL